MGGAGAALERAALFQDHLAQRRNGMRQEVGAILLGREQHEVGYALGHHGRDLAEVIGAALDVLLDEFVDVAVQAIGHRVLPSLSVKSSPPISRANGLRGSWMRKARRGWTMLEEDA